MDSDRGRQRNFDHYQSLTMKRFFTILATIALCASSSAQTVKPLAYNLTNGTVMVSTNVTWSNSFKFSTNTVAAQVRTNLGLGWSALTNSNAATSLLGYTTNGQVVANTGTNVLIFTNYVEFEDGQGVRSSGDFGVIAETIFVDGIIEFSGTNPPLSASATRTNLSLGWSALTNSNAANFQAAVFSATNTAPTNTTNVAGWINVSVGSGTNVYKLPVYK